MNIHVTLGSLFDGAGTCQFAARQYGITTLWSSEIEKFCCDVTARRFPNTKQLGDITKIEGAKIAPVDIISFGSPCQDLSVAGKRSGLDGKRSGLFMEAVRIIKEMREITNGEYPKLAIWENVPGAFSSNKGEDFRVVLEEFCKVKDRNAAVPRPAKWSNAGLIVADGYSIAWRVLDAQFWGVPQRRRRIFLVADFGGQSAGKILFEREGLSRDFAESRETWQGIAGIAAGGVDTEAQRGEGVGIDCLNPWDTQASRVYSDRGIWHSLNANSNGGQSRDAVLISSETKVWDARGNGNGMISPAITGDHNNRVTDYTGIVVKAVNQNADGEIRENDVAYTLSTNGNPSGRNAPIVCYPDKARTLTARYDGSPCIDRGQNIVCASFKSFGEYAESTTSKSLLASDDITTGDLIVFGVDCRNMTENENLCPTLQAKDGGGYSLNYTSPVRIGTIIRRLTPTECARLQGMPDWWCADIPHSDSAEYKMWGNGMALPCIMYVFEGVIKKEIDSFGLSASYGTESPGVEL